MNGTYQPDTTTIEQLAKEAFNGQVTNIAQSYANNIEQVKILTNQLILEYQKWNHVLSKAKNYSLELQVIAKKQFIKSFYKKLLVISDNHSHQ